MHPTTPSVHDGGRFCTNCMAEVGRTLLMKCGRCQSARYCSKNCQTEHWTQHKPFCDNVVKTRAYIDPSLLGPYDSISNAIRRWGDRWDFELRKWASIGIDLATSYATDRVEKYICVVDLNCRENSPGPSEAFVMTSAKIMKNEDYFRKLTEIGVEDVKPTEDLALRREGNRMVLAIICEGLVNCLHFKYLEVVTPTNVPNISDAVMKKWEESFINFIESGDVSEDNSDERLFAFFRTSFPDVPVLKM